MRQMLCAVVMAVAAMLVGAGCIDVTTTVAVNKDGSGVIVEEGYVNMAVIEQMMGQMAAGMGGGTAKPAGGARKSQVDMKKLTAKAAALGQGVRLVSAKDVKTADGRQGVRAIFAFDDIRKIKVNADPDVPGGQGGGESYLRFDFTPGETAKLVIRMPSDKPADEAGDELLLEDLGGDGAGSKDEGGDSPSKEELAMMKMMFSGFRARAIIRVEGDIVDTNAAHVQRSPGTGLKQYVTLFDMDIGKLLGNMDKLEELTKKTGKPESMTAAIEALGGVEGILVEPSKEVSISFR